jgi:hypothetical protein
LKTAGVHDGLGAVISVWQSCKYLLWNIAEWWCDWRGE